MPTITHGVTQTKFDADCTEYLDDEYDAAEVQRAVRNQFPDGRDEFIFTMHDGDRPWTLKLHKRGSAYIGTYCPDDDITGYPAEMRLWTSPDDADELLLLGTWQDVDNDGKLIPWSLLLTRLDVDTA